MTELNRLSVANGLRSAGVNRPAVQQGQSRRAFPGQSAADKTRTEGKLATVSASQKRTVVRMIISLVHEIG
jgi:hypothetical protein